MVEVVVDMVEALAVAMAILVALPTITWPLTKERTLQRTVGTEVTTGTEVATWGGGPYWGWSGDPYSDDYPCCRMLGTLAQPSLSEVAPSEQTIVAVQKELTKLGYYHGQIDGIVGPETRKAISWFQSVDKLSVSGRIDDPTLKALQIS